jgi:hypothetical protein
MIAGFRRTATAATAVLVLAGGGVAWAATSASARSAASAPSAAIGSCTANDLAVWVYADGADGVSGTTYYHLEYTNLGRSACYLNGYPDVSATTLSGARLGEPAAHNNGVPAKTIDLAPDATAHSVLGYVNKAVGPACKPKTASFLRVDAPGARQAKRAFFPLSVCTTGNVDLNVRRVQTGP